jgi:hypothetical protein
MFLRLFLCLSLQWNRYYLVWIVREGVATGGGNVQIPESELDSSEFELALELDPVI